MNSTINFLGSYRLTLWLIPLLALGILLYVTDRPFSDMALLIPSIAFSLNLSFAIFNNEKIFRNLSLLIAHLGILVFLSLLGLSSLTYLKGTLELTEGEEFNGKLITEESGLFHLRSLDQLSFINKGFSVDYLPHVHRNETKNEVEFENSNGELQHTLVGDQHPLILNGYRFYTSFNKGFSAMFSWRPKAKPEQIIVGSVHLPSFPMNEYNQAREWIIPDTGIQVWTLLNSEQTILDEEKSFTLKPPEKHHIVLRIGDERYQLRKGQVLTLPEGMLVYSGLKMWMGYNVFYDWTRPWLLASVLVVIISMGWHFVSVQLIAMKKSSQISPIEVEL